MGKTVEICASNAKNMEPVTQVMATGSIYIFLQLYL